MPEGSARTGRCAQRCSHVRTPARVTRQRSPATSAHGDRADRALAEFAVAYAAQNRADHEALVQAIADGRIEARSDL